MVVMLGYPQGHLASKIRLEQEATGEKLIWDGARVLFDGQKKINTISCRQGRPDANNFYLPAVDVLPPQKQKFRVPALRVLKTEQLSADEQELIKDKINGIKSDFSFYDYVEGIASRQIFQSWKLLPIRSNRNGGFEKLIEYELSWTKDESEKLPSLSLPQNVTNSVLASGTWYKIATTKDAIYRINRSFLQSCGMDVSSVDPRNIRIYGNGGGLLPEQNAAFRYDDLTENSIFISGESDGSFDAGDYILFYGRSTHKWKFDRAATNGLQYTFIKNYFSDTAYFYITADLGPGKRIQPLASNPNAPTDFCTAFDDFSHREIDAVNLVKSGREFYGEYFDITTQYSYAFPFPGLVSNDTVRVKVNLAGRNIGSDCYFRVDHNSGNYQLQCSQTGSSYLDNVGNENYGLGAQSFLFNDPANPTTVNIKVTKLTSSATGWMNYVTVNCRRSLSLSGSQMLFRDNRTVGAGRITRFTLTGGNSNTQVWNVTDENNPSQVQLIPNGFAFDFTLATDSLLQFIAFNGQSYEIPVFKGSVQNQNLHSHNPVDYIIVCHPQFVSQANQLIALHQQYEGFSGEVVTTEQIYNEFSSGTPDITAIRDYVRMLYNRSTGFSQPRYLLLLGDGSYDNKNRFASGNTALIPTFQTQNSTSYLVSKTGDDFFAYLDNSEGYLDASGTTANIMDIGVGRLPVKNQTEASAVVNKIIRYYQLENETSVGCSQVIAKSGEWRNWVCLLSDDVDKGNGWEITFFNQSETFAGLIEGQDKKILIDKIYLDAYVQEAVPGGQRYPDAFKAVNERIAKGALLLGYSGHGGELGLTTEEVINVPQIQGWTNASNLPLFFTATCEFSRFDDPARTSAGEYVLLNPNGGGIALLTTTRVAFANDADYIGPPFYLNAFSLMPSGNYPTIGDIFLKTKQLALNKLHFSLLGDPALTLSYPRHEIKTTAINNSPVTGIYDTIRALEKYTIKGSVYDQTGVKLSNFNGTVYPTVFDKRQVLSTLGNDEPTAAKNFQQRKSVIYKGKSEVVNGDFEFTFMVPKDINYQFGVGKISYYAANNTLNAAGFYDSVIVGGSGNNAVNDQAGPGIKLFMNDNKFVRGGLTSESPFIYAEISDSSGINTVGNGIGHDIVAILDRNTAAPIVLNDYYSADLNSFQSGKIKYQMSNLSEGSHSLSLKVWDILNNSSTSETEFVVAKSEKMALAHVLNYPNPFTNSTQFFIEHNQYCDELNLKIQIFTISGKLVKTIERIVHSEGFRSDGIPWDGKDDFGDKLARGVYVYKVTVKDNLGAKAEKIEKLVILN